MVCEVSYSAAAFSDSYVLVVRYEPSGPGSKGIKHYSIKKDNNDNYFIQSTAVFSDLIALIDNYKSRSRLTTLCWWKQAISMKNVTIFTLLKPKEIGLPIFVAAPCIVDMVTS